MTEIICALVDPNTHKVRYVGRTSESAGKRLRHHITASRRCKLPPPLYEWIRSLSPSKPVLVVLQEVVCATVLVEDGRREYTASAAEAKWIKRFERGQLFNWIDRDSRAYKRLVNPF